MDLYLHLPFIKEKLHGPLPNPFTMREKFLKLRSHNEVADLFGLTYPALAKIIYKTGPRYKYHEFQIPKKNGGYRQISAPSKKLKDVQSQLNDVLYEIYPGKPATHGFVKQRSIVTNAKQHLDKKFIFNIDISDFFKSIHFGRIRNLFKSQPFNFNNTVSTILTQICCFNNALPQGAPTSPILSNLIAWKLDAQLQQLAKKTNCTYTRYADDISFSFTCPKNRISDDVLTHNDGTVQPGLVLKNIIEVNGFKINQEKVRLCSKYSRMEVTGLVVNEFPNVRRNYVRQLSSMLHAWRKHGYELAALEYNKSYNKKYHASGKPKSFLHVVKGKLAFLRSVRGGRDELFIKLASQFNSLVDDKDKFKIIKSTSPEQQAIDSLWIIEACYDDEDGEAKVSQGSGFLLKDQGVITCAHVVADKKEIFKKLKAYKYSDISKKYEIKVQKMCRHRDVAVCSIPGDGDVLPPDNYIEVSDKPVAMQDDIKLLGFPAYAPGQSYYIAEGKIAKLYTQSCVKKFEIDQLIREGNSGGPVVNADSKVVGIALEGARKESGNNGCLMMSEVYEVLMSDRYKVS